MTQDGIDSVCHKRYGAVALHDLPGHTAFNAELSAASGLDRIDAQVRSNGGRI